MTRLPNADEESEDSIDFDLLGIVRRRFHWIALGALIGVTCGAIFYVKETPIYESRMSVLVGQLSTKMATTGVRDASSDTASLGEELLATHVELFQSPRVLADAIKRGQLNRDAGELRANLSVGKGGTASILNASYRDPDPERAVRILNAIFEAYEAYFDSQTRNVGAEAAELIANAQEKNETELRKADQEYRDFVASVPALVSVSGSGVGALQDVHRTRLQSIENELASVRQDLAAAKSRRQVIVEACRGKQAADMSDAEVMSLLSDDDVARLELVINIGQKRTSTQSSSLEETVAGEAYRAKSKKMLELLSQRRVLKTTYGEGHPSIVALDTEITSLNRIRPPSSDDEIESDKFDVPPGEILQLYYGVLKSDIKELERREAELLALSEEESKLAKEVELSFLKGVSLKANLERVQSRYDEVFKRLQEINLTNDYAGFSIDLLVTPVPAGAPVWPSKSKLLAAGTMIGLLAGFAIGILAELSDRRLRDPDEVESIVNAPVLAHLSGLRGAVRRGRATAHPNSSISKTISTFHFPCGTDSETFRVVRTSLLFLARKDSKQLFLVTSPSPGDGKSTITSNLAVSLAQTGKRVCLLDADMRRPTVASLFGCEHSPGLSDALAEATAFDNVLHSTEQSGLKICPAGSRTASPSELLESNAFARFCEQLREAFDIVLIDSPPLLAVADPAILSRHTDGNLLVLRVENNRRSMVQSAINVLHDQRAGFDGVIVNSQEAKSKSFGYSAYNYYSKDQYGYVDGYRRYYESADETGNASNGHHPRKNGKPLNGQPQLSRL